MDESIRTSGFKSQNEYDVLLSDLDISSLKFLAHKYAKDLKYFRSHNNLNDQENAQAYKEMQQRYKMIDEELSFREAMHSYDESEVIVVYPSINEEDYNEEDE